MAFANARGINHSLAHKTGGGRTSRPCDFDCDAARDSFQRRIRRGQGAPFPRYEVYRAQKDYADIARALGLKGRTDADLVEAVCNKIEELMKAVDVALSFRPGY